MITIKIDAGLEVFSFAPDGGDFVTNIVVLYDDDRALFIDSGYEHHAAAAAIRIGSSDQIKTVVLSHEHEDHAHGCRVLPEARIIVAEGFAEGFADDLFKDHLVDEVADGSRMSFGKHNLSFHSTPGHSLTHLTTVINDSIAHVGDLLIFTSDGQPTPPYLGEYNSVQDNNSIEDHIQSLKLLSESCTLIF